MPKAAISELASGPGKLAAALGIDRSLNGEPLTGNRLWITSGKEISPEEVGASPRIGIAYAQEDAKLPWRFYIRGHACVSKT
jgi:DNA-3-methyladenine glycosylase